jgi:hypothetical protein
LEEVEEGAEQEGSDGEEDDVFRVLECDQQILEGQ